MYRHARYLAILLSGCGAGLASISGVYWQAYRNACAPIRPPNNMPDPQENHLQNGRAVAHRVL